MIMHASFVQEKLSVFLPLCSPCLLMSDSVRKYGLTQTLIYYIMQINNLRG